MKNKCLICENDLITHDAPIRHRCEVCTSTFMARIACVEGHYVCELCHLKGALDYIDVCCIAYGGLSPYQLVNGVMKSDLLDMNGPEHHYLFAASVLTCYLNARGKGDMLEKSLPVLRKKVLNIGSKDCYVHGVCALPLGIGAFLSIITQKSSAQDMAHHLCDRAVGEAYTRIGEMGGHRCCKKCLYGSLDVICDVLDRDLHVTLERDKFTNCPFSSENDGCDQKECNFFEASVE